MNIHGSRKRFWIVTGGIILLIILLILFVDAAHLWYLLQSIEWGRIAVAVLFILSGYLLVVVRMRYLLLNQPGWWQTFYGNSIGYMLHASMFVPAMAGRIISLNWVTHISVPRVSSAVLVERLLEQIMRLLATILVIVLFTSQYTHPTIGIGGSLLMLTAAFGAIFWILHHREKVVNWLANKLGQTRFTNEERVRSTASSLLEGLEIISSTPRLLYMLFISMMMWACFLAFQYLIFTALFPNFALLQALLIAGVVLMVMPPSINLTPIIYHVVVIATLTIFNVTDITVAIVYAIALHFTMMLFWLIAGKLSLQQTGLTLKQLVEEVKKQSAKAKADRVG